METLSNNKLIKIGEGRLIDLLVVVVDAFPDLAHVVLYCPKHTHSIKSTNETKVNSNISKSSFGARTK
jgi:hypothetical protein